MRNGNHPGGISTFRRGLLASPFQVPILTYLFVQGIIFLLSAGEVATELDVPVWSIWNFALALAAGSGLAVLSRFNDNERLETFGLQLVILSLFISAGISIAAHDYNLGAEVAIGLACLLRVRVLAKSRKAEKVAIEISEEATDDDRETP
jgi:hypothetical protein